MVQKSKEKLELIIQAFLSAHTYNDDMERRGRSLLPPNLSKIWLSQSG